MKKKNGVRVRMTKRTDRPFRFGSVGSKCSGQTLTPIEGGRKERKNERKTERRGGGREREREREIPRRSNEKRNTRTK